MAKTTEATQRAEILRLEGFDPAGVLTGWADAAGLAGLKPGACFSPEDDRLFALGWPHLRFVVDGHRDDREPAAAAARLLAGASIPHGFVWGRKTAERFVRALGASSVFELQPLAKELRPEALEALWTEDAVRPVDVLPILSARMGGETPGMPDRAWPALVFLLEALVGSEAVATAMVDILESMVPGLLVDGAGGPPQMSFQLGFLLQRVRVPVATALRERLHGVLGAVQSQYPAFRNGFSAVANCHAKALHLVLGGAAAAEKSSDRSPRWYVHAGDDPAIVRRRVAVNRMGWLPDARLAWLGGPTVIRHLHRDAGKLATAEDQKLFLRQLMPLRSPEMLPMMLDLSVHSPVRAEAQEWLVAHRDFSEPFLAEQAKTGAVAEAALRRMQKTASAAASAG